MGGSHSVHNTVKNVNEAVNDTVAKAYQSVTSTFNSKQELKLDCSDAIKAYNDTLIQCEKDFINEGKSTDDAIRLCNLMKPACVGEYITFKNSVIIDTKMTQQSQTMINILNQIGTNLKSNIQQKTGTFEYGDKANNTIENLQRTINKNFLDINNQISTDTSIQQNVVIGAGTLTNVTLENFHKKIGEILQKSEQYNSQVTSLATDITAETNQNSWNLNAIIVLVIGIIGIIISIGVTVRIAKGGGGDGGSTQKTVATVITLLFLLASFIGLIYASVNIKKNVTNKVLVGVFSTLVVVFMILLFVILKKM